MSVLYVFGGSGDSCWPCSYTQWVTARDQGNGVCVIFEAGTKSGYAIVFRKESELFVPSLNERECEVVNLTFYSSRSTHCLWDTGDSHMQWWNVTK